MRNLSIMAAALLCLSLGACSELEQAVPPAPKTAQQTVFETKAAFVSAEDAALAWAGQVCPTPSICQDARVKTVMQAIITADTLINAAETSAQANASTTSSATQQAIDDATTALTALQNILAQYGVSGSTATANKGS